MVKMTEAQAKALRDEGKIIAKNVVFNGREFLTKKQAETARETGQVASVSPGHAQAAMDKPENEPDDTETNK